MSRVLIPLPSRDFDPTEAAVPWRELTQRGHDVRFATPDGSVASADPRMLDGRGLGPWRLFLPEDVDALLLPGGHAPGMRVYLESHRLQELVSAAFARQIPVGAICHGVVLASRARGADGRSVLYGRSTTALTRSLELTAWALTALWLGDYYRTYPITVQEEVTHTLAHPGDFQVGPMAILRDAPDHPERGFVVRDGNYLSARWPGDAHRFASEFAAML